ncbi:addiction module toxin RelE [Candidatus Woesearchaeota archaeon]|nr:addiction module toxin RelE [Candidatus Woesearchaeota archaeon]
MRDFSVEDKLEKKLGKIFRKDRVLYEAVMKKIEEILSCPDVHHYKNLHSPLQKYQRVHVKSSFVLLFEYLETEDLVIFYDLDHHDFIYQ